MDEIVDFFGIGFAQLLHDLLDGWVVLSFKLQFCEHRMQLPTYVINEFIPANSATDAPAHTRFGRR
jgi:hypothetical protein